MSFLDVSLEDTPQLEAVEEGEYQIQVNRAKVGEASSGNGKYLLLYCEVPSISESKDFTHVLMLPNDQDSEKQKIKKMNRLKDCMDAFSYDYADGIETDDLEGLEGWAHLAIKEDPDFGEQNRVVKFIPPQ